VKNHQIYFRKTVIGLMHPNDFYVLKLLLRLEALRQFKVVFHPFPQVRAFTLQLQH